MSFIMIDELIILSKIRCNFTNIRGLCSSFNSSKFFLNQALVDILAICKIK